MSHHCQACLITCEDFRLHQRKDGRNYISEFIKNLGVDCDLITRGGAVQDLVRPLNDGFSASLLRDIGVSVELHGADTVYLLNHQDCGAYSDFDFTVVDEINQHKDDLKEAKKIILDKFPNVKVKLYFGYLQNNSVDNFDFREI